jgi:hypothetical protein
VPTTKPTTGFAQAVDAAANQPLSPDLEDQRNISLLGKAKNIFGYGEMRAGQVWDELKREYHGDNSGPPGSNIGVAQQGVPLSSTQTVPTKITDTSFYNPAADASRQLFLPDGYKLESSPAAPVKPKPKAKGLSVQQVKAMAATLNPTK